MYLTGFADEAGADIDTQIRATKELGWSRIELRNVSVDGSETANLHDVPEEVFDKVRTRLAEAGVTVNCFGSTIMNWGKSVDDPVDVTMAEVDRAIPRMQALGTKLIRVMSFKPVPNADLAGQKAEQRFAIMRDVVKRFTDAGLQPVHENCNNYGGIGWEQSLQIVENVPGIKLVFDPGNPPVKVGGDFSWDHGFEKGWSWDFYSHVRDHTAYMHIKDCTYKGGKHHEWAGEGVGQIPEILTDLRERGYDGGFSIEPHIASVFHDEAVASEADTKYKAYVEYGKRFMDLLERCGYEVASFA